MIETYTTNQMQIVNNFLKIVAQKLSHVKKKCYIYYINNKQLKTNKMKNQEMNIETLENKLNEMESLAHAKMEEIQETTPAEANDFCELYYELDGLTNDINWINDDYEGAELVEAMESIIGQLEYLLQK